MQPSSSKVRRKEESAPPLHANQLLDAIEFRFAAGNRSQDGIVRSRVADLFAAEQEPYFIFQDCAWRH
jgi:hypothetical protein